MKVKRTFHTSDLQQSSIISSNLSCLSDCLVILAIMCATLSLLWVSQWTFNMMAPMGHNDSPALLCCYYRQDSDKVRFKKKASVGVTWEIYFFNNTPCLQRKFVWNWCYNYTDIIYKIFSETDHHQFTAGEKHFPYKPYIFHTLNFYLFIYF